MLRQDFLMASLFTASEVALARLGLDICANGDLHVLVGRLGLSATSQGVRESETSSNLIVIKYSAPVIDWYETATLPTATGRADVHRCRMVEGESGLDPAAPVRQFDPVLVDIDHPPDHPLDDRSTSFYRADVLAAAGRDLKQHGAFDLWSNECEDESFIDWLPSASARGWAQLLAFDKPLTGRPFMQTAQLAHKGGA
jgi:hypothetical protein